MWNYMLKFEKMHCKLTGHTIIPSPARLAHTLRNFITILHTMMIVFAINSLEFSNIFEKNIIKLFF